MATGITAANIHPQKAIAKDAASSVLKTSAIYSCTRVNKLSVQVVLEQGYPLQHKTLTLSPGWTFLPPPNLFRRK